MNEEEKRRSLYTQEIFDEYERRFAAARAARSLRQPWVESDREAIIADAKSVLRWKDELVPEIRILSREKHLCDGYWLTDIVYESWEGFYGAATLFSPLDEGVHPVVFQCNGHTKRGRLSEAPVIMCIRLARQGCYVLANDNIGQGEREALGHWNVVVPFACGLTLQGLIVMETAAWIRYMQKQPYVDASRMGACGNSGGGTLTTFLAALAPELSAIASTGYPSEFAYILQKERGHCACNLLMGFAGKLDMWELHSVFAPKPLLLEQGNYDNLIPVDYFLRNARKVRHTYAQMDAEDCFEQTITDTKHSWEPADRVRISAFFAKRFGLLPPEDKDAEQNYVIRDPEASCVRLPRGMTVDELAQKLTGVTVDPDITLPEVFLPTCRGIPVDPGAIVPDLGRGDVMRVFAQFECSLDGTVTGKPHIV